MRDPKKLYSRSEKIGFTEIEASFELPQSMTGLQWFKITNINAPAACQRQTNPLWKIIKILDFTYFSFSYINFLAFFSSSTLLPSQVSSKIILSKSVTQSCQIKVVHKIRICKFFTPLFTCCIIKFHNRS